MDSSACQSGKNETVGECMVCCKADWRLRGARHDGTVGYCIQESKGCLDSFIFYPTFVNPYLNISSLSRRLGRCIAQNGCNFGFGGVLYCMYRDVWNTPYFLFRQYCTFMQCALTPRPTVGSVFAFSCHSRRFINLFIHSGQNLSQGC